MNHEIILIKQGVLPMYGGLPCSYHVFAIATYFCPIILPNMIRPVWRDRDEMRIAANAHRKLRMKKRHQAATWAESQYILKVSNAESKFVCLYYALKVCRLLFLWRNVHIYKCVAEELWDILPLSQPVTQTDLSIIVSKIKSSTFHFLLYRSRREMQKHVDISRGSFMQITLLIL